MLKQIRHRQRAWLAVRPARRHQGAMKRFPVLLFALVGVGLVGLGLWLAMADRDHRARGRVAEAVVVRLEVIREQRIDGEPRERRTPVVRFEAEDGTRIETPLKLPGAATPGERRRVRYDPKNLRNVVFDDDPAPTLTGYVLVALGGLALLAALAGGAWRRRR
jgi:MYXO-CTERM domain-containing protein